MLGEHGYNTYCVGKWHLTPGEECNLAAYKGRWPLGRGFERFYGFLGGESSSWYPDLVHDNHQIDAPATPEEGYHLSKDLSDRAIEFIRDGKVIDPDKPFFMYLAPQAGHAPHHAPKEWADKYKGRFDEGYEAIRAGDPRPPEASSASCPRTPSSPRSTPTASRERTGPDGQPWPVLDTVRPWDSLERRRAAAVLPDGRGVRRLHLLRRPRARPGARLPRGVGPARQHPDRAWSPTTAPAARAARTASFNEWRFFNGVADTTEAHAPAHRRARQPHFLQPLQHRLGVGLRHPVPLLEALGRLRGGRRRHVPGVLAGQDPAAGRGRASSTSTPSTWSRRSTSSSASSRPTSSRATRRVPIEGESFAASLTDPACPGKRTQFYAMLGQRSIYHDGWLACTLHPPISGWGNFEQGRVGALPPRGRPRPEP